MQSKRLFQIFVLLTLLFSPFGNNQQVRASTASIDQLDAVQDQPTASMAVNPSSINIGGTATVTVSLDNVPAEGYTSVELTCTYYPNLVEASNIVVANLFGTDPVVAINGPQNDRFIVAIAGSDGNKAMHSGTVMTFNVRGLQTGQSPMECQARASKGYNALTNIASTGNNVIVLGATPTSTSGFCDSAEFIADINVPPGTMMAPGAQFRKTWRLKNVGSCNWTTLYQLVFFSGEQMSAPSSANFPTNVEVGETVDLSLNMTAPLVAGSYRGYWMFKNANRALFGIGSQANEPWFVDIVVSNTTVTPGPTFTQSPAPNTPTATATPSQTQTPSGPTNTPIPSVTPGGPTATQIPGVAYDFVAGMCVATWTSGAGQLPCPGIDGDVKGFVLRVDNPRLETGVTDTRPALLTFPQNVQNGTIQGVFPPIHIQNGDRFRSTLTCEFGATGCYVAFRIDYQIGSDPIKTFWGPFLERYEGQYYSADIDLSPLAGKDVKFILTVLSAGYATGDRALWVSPIIYRAGAGSTPTADGSPLPTFTLIPVESPTPITPTEAPTSIFSPTPAPEDYGAINGHALASKPVIVSLYDVNNILIGSVAASDDGTFGLAALPGTYAVIATADGFLSAQGFVIFTAGNTSILPTIHLPAGDLDHNNVIDQLDAMTIGMNYNTAAPSEADLNSDGIINVLDLELLAKNYRKMGPVPWQ